MKRRVTLFFLNAGGTAGISRPGMSGLMFRDFFIRKLSEQEEKREKARKQTWSLLQGRKMEDIDERLQQLRDQEGKKFFNPATQDIFPEADFSACIAREIFECAIVIERGEEYDTARCIHA